eukprot:768701-Hanusia_phi.AAC.8
MSGGGRGDEHERREAEGHVVGKDWEVSLPSAQLVNPVCDVHLLEPSDETGSRSSCASRALSDVEHAAHGDGCRWRRSAGEGMATDSATSHMCTQCCAIMVPVPLLPGEEARGEETGEEGRRGEEDTQESGSVTSFISYGHACVAINNDEDVVFIGGEVMMKRLARVDMRGAGWFQEIQRCLCLPYLHVTLLPSSESFKTHVL